MLDFERPLRRQVRVVENREDGRWDREWGRRGGGGE